MTSGIGAVSPVHRGTCYDKRERDGCRDEERRERKRKTEIFRKHVEKSVRREEEEEHRRQSVS